MLTVLHAIILILSEEPQSNPELFKSSELGFARLWLRYLVVGKPVKPGRRKQVPVNIA